MKIQLTGLPWWCSGWDCSPTAGGMGLIPGQGNKIPHAVWYCQKKNNKKENTAYKHPWETAKAVLRRNFIALNALQKKRRKKKISKWSSHLKNLEKKEQSKLKENRREEIIHIRGEFFFNWKPKQQRKSEKKRAGPLRTIKMTNL